MKTLSKLLCGGAALGALALIVTKTTHSKPDAHATAKDKHKDQLIESLQRSLSQEKHLRMEVQKKNADLMRERAMQRMPLPHLNGHGAPPLTSPAQTVQQ